VSGEAQVQQTGQLPRLTDRERRRASADEAPAPGYYLAIEDGESVVHIRLEAAVTRVGRGMTATVHLDDPTVSRRHALFVQRDGDVVLCDDRSTNGTWLNGERIREATLAHGDVIQLGAVRLRYLDVPPAS
jgi:pSer/pThr/pTyr-binding forkhead associated (FHA) protein